MEELTFYRSITEVNRLYKEEDDLYRRLARRSGLSDAAFWILYTMEIAQRPITQAEIGSMLILSKQTINSALKRLEQSGQIRLTSGPGRKKYLQFTEQGRALADRAIRPALETERRAFQSLSPEERSGLLDLERRYVALLRQSAKGFFDISQEE